LDFKSGQKPTFLLGRKMSLYRGKIIRAIERLVIPILEDEGLELVDIEFQRERRGLFLRIYIDKNGGINLADCTALNHRLSAILDVEDIIDTNYILEVSSPGLTRPLKKTQDYKKYQGHLVRIKTYKPIDNQKIFKGVLVDLKDGIVKIEYKEKKWLIPLETIAKANLDFEF
jgi:ribosome maturation factor RimP